MRKYYQENDEHRERIKAAAKNRYKKIKEIRAGLLQKIEEIKQNLI